MTTNTTSGAADLPEALRIAAALEYCDANVAREAITELRRPHAENGHLHPANPGDTESGPEGEWYCETHPDQLMGHAGCGGAGIPACARIGMLMNQLRLTKQEVREANRMRDEMAAAARRTQAISQPGGFDAGDMASAAAQGYRDGWTAAQPVPAAVAGPVAVLKFERGTPGRQNEMPRVVSCNWMPDGEYEVYLAAAPTTQTAPATQQAGEALSDDLRDRLVAISEAIADQDDRAAQAMLREILKAPQPSPTPQADSQPALGRDRIREIFMAHGFTVKEGQTDLKQYVYDAADALLRAARAPADSVLEDAARWQDHVGKLDALVAYCPTCCQGFIAKQDMTRDEVLFACGKAVGQSGAKRLGEALDLAVDHIDMDALRISHCKDAAAIDAARAAQKEGEKP